MYICNHENNVPSWLSLQWLCGNSCSWAHGVISTMYTYLYIHIYTYIHIHLYIHIYIYIYIHIYIYIYIYTYIYTHTHTFIHTYLYIHIYTYVYMFTIVYKCDQNPIFAGCRFGNKIHDFSTLGGFNQVPQW